MIRNRAIEEENENVPSTSTDRQPEESNASDLRESLSSDVPTTTAGQGQFLVARQLTRLEFELPLLVRVLSALALLSDVKFNVLIQFKGNWKS